MRVQNLITFKTLMMVQSNDEALYNIEHKYNTQFKSDFQYLKNCLHLVEKTLTYMGKRLFNKLQKLNK